MPAEFPLPPAQRPFQQPAFRRNSLLSLSFGRTIDRDRFRDAWRTLVRVHPALRSSFHHSNLLEYEAGSDDLPVWEEPDWSTEDPERIPSLWQELQERAAADFFEENVYPLWRVYLIKLPGGQSHLLVSFHPALIDRQSASTLLIQWLNASEADPSLLDGLPVLPSLAIANASVDLGEPTNAFWPDDWQGDCALEVLRPWHWLRPTVDETSANVCSPVLVTQSIPSNFIEAVHAKAGEFDVSAQDILSLLWAGFWAMRSEVCGALVAHPFDLSNHLAPEHREILGRLSPLAPLAIQKAPPADRTWAADWWSAQLAVVRESGSHIFAQPPPNLDDMILGAGLPVTEVCPGSAAFWSGESINDLLHTRLPRWLGADARWSEFPALPVSLFVQGGRHPELSLVAHPVHLDQSTCHVIVSEFLESARRALGVVDASLAAPAVARKTSPEGSLFALSSEPGISERLAEALVTNAGSTILSMGESTMSGSDLLGCSNQLARYLRRSKLPEGSRYLVNLTPGNWLSLLLLTLVREGLPFLACDDIVAADQPADWFENEKIGCVFLDSTTAVGWEGREIKKIVIDAVWEKVGAMSDATLQAKKPTGPTIWEFGAVQGDRRLRIGEALLASSLPAAAEFWGLETGSRLLSTASPGSPAWLEETLLSCLTGSTLVHPGQDIFATRSAFQEALQGLQITHLGLPAIRWSDWIHFLAELRQDLPADLRRVLIRSGRMGTKAVREWLRISGEKVHTSIFSPLLSMSAPGVGAELDEKLLPLLAQGLIPLGFPLGNTEIFAQSKEGVRLPPGAVGELRITLPASAIVDGVLTSEHKLYGRGIVHNSGFVSCLTQPDVSTEGWRRPPAPVSAIAEHSLLKHAEIFDAIVTRSPSSDGAETRHLQAWVIPQESGGSLPNGLAIWWKNESNSAWTLEAAAAIPKCPISKDGNLDTTALPIPATLAFKPAPLPSSKIPVNTGKNTAMPEPTQPSEWQVQWSQPRSENSRALIICGTFPFSNLAESLLESAANIETSIVVASAPIPRPRQSLAADCTEAVCIASGTDCWDFLRWFNSLDPSQQECIEVLLVQPALVENADGLDTKLKSLWNKILGKTAPGNARREATRGIRPVRCQASMRVLCDKEPEAAITTYLPEAEFFAGDLASAETMASAILDVLNEDSPGD